MLSVLVDDSADGIDVESEVCNLMGFEPATYELVEELAEMGIERSFENVISERF